MKPPVPIYMKFYFFHVLNPKEVQTGKARPRIVEKGPYSYYQFRQKINISSRSEGEEFIREVYIISKRSSLSL